MTVTTFRTVKNNVSVALLNAALAGDATWTVTAGQGAQYPATPFFVSCDSEVAICTARAGDVLTVTRGQDGTAAAAHGAGALVEIRPIAGLFAELQAAINALEAGNNGVPRYNQLTNGGFEFNQRGLTTYANNVLGLDRWATAATGTAAFTSAGPDATHVDTHSGQCLAVVVSATSGDAVNYVVVEQKLEQVVALRGQPVSVSFRVQSVAAGSVRGWWFDGVTGGAANQFGPVQATPAGGYTTYRFTFTPAANATQLWVGLALDTVTTWYVDNAMAVTGSQAADYVPLPTADDLARCLRCYQRWTVGGPNSAIGTGLAQSATTTVVLIPIQTRMGGPPSLSFSAVGDFQVLNGGGGAVAAASIGGLALLQSGLHLQVNVAAGLTLGQATLFESANSAAWLAAEWNP